MLKSAPVWRCQWLFLGSFFAVTIHAIHFAILICAFPGHWMTLVSCCILPFLTSDIPGLWHLQAFIDYMLRGWRSGPVATTRWPTHRHSSWLWYWAWCRRSSQEIGCKQLFAYDAFLLLNVFDVFQHVDVMDCFRCSYACYHWFAKDIAF